MSQTITLMLDLRRETAQAYGVFEGAAEDIVDPTTGEIRTTERLVWLPKSQIKITARQTAQGRTVITADVPEWLAVKAGLLGDRCTGTKDLFR